VRYRAAALIGVAGMVLAPVGVWVGRRVPNAPLLCGFALVLAFVAWRMLRQSTRRAGCGKLAQSPHQPTCVVDSASGRLQWTAPCARALAATGMVSGLLTGLLGVGGGFVIVPSLTRNTDLDALSITATSLAVIALVSISGVAAAAWSGTMAWGVALPFGTGAVAALLIGRRLARRIADARLQQGFAALSAAVSVLLLLRAVGWIGA